MNVEVKGAPLPVAICYLASGESIITEKGAMSWMSPNLEMQTKGGGIGKMFSRALQGEAMFQNIYTAVGGEGMIAMGSSFPGDIMVVDVSASPIVAQKSAFLASESTVVNELFFRKKVGNFLTKNVSKFLGSNIFVASHTFLNALDNLQRRIYSDI